MGDWGRGPPVSPRFFPALSLALFFARAPLSERLEQAKKRKVVKEGADKEFDCQTSCFRLQVV